MTKDTGSLPYQGSCCRRLTGYSEDVFIVVVTNLVQQPKKKSFDYFQLMSSAGQAHFADWSLHCLHWDHVCSDSGLPWQVILWAQRKQKENCKGPKPKLAEIWLSKVYITWNWAGHLSPFGIAHFAINQKRMLHLAYFTSCAHGTPKHISNVANKPAQLFNWGQEPQRQPQSWSKFFIPLQHCIPVSITATFSANCIS